MIKKIMKVLFGVIFGIIAILLIYVLTESILSRMSASQNAGTLPKTIKVFVFSNDVHTDLVFPIRQQQMDWTSLFPLANNLGTDSSSYQYVGVGWGDKGFYLNTPEWKDLKASTAFVAATGLGETALHVSYHKKMVLSDLCYEYMIDSIQYQALIDYVKGSLDLDAAGKPIFIHTTAQYGKDDAFYEAKGSYSMFHSCNTWANTALKKANMPAGIWASFDKGILSHYKK